MICKTVNPESSMQFRVGMDHFSPKKNKYRTKHNRYGPSRRKYGENFSELLLKEEKKLIQNTQNTVRDKVPCIKLEDGIHIMVNSKKCLCGVTHTFNLTLSPVKNKEWKMLKDITCAKCRDIAKKNY